jgi:prophage endopeptidase
MSRALSITALLAAALVAAIWLGVSAWQDALSDAFKAGELAEQQRAERGRAQANAAFSRIERALRGQVDTLTLTLQQEKARREALSSQFADRLRAGAVRVSVPVAACHPAEPAGDPSAGHPAARAELAPETALALDRIAGDGDAAILELNTCLVAHAQARAAVEQASAALQAAAH